MLIRYETEMSAYMLRLKEAGSSVWIIDSNRRCYESLQAYLSMSGIAFTMEAALQWLESRRSDWSHGSYCAYRNSLFRFERYLLTGDVSRTLCYSIDQFDCRDKAMGLPKQMYELFVEFKSTLFAKFNESNAYRYSQGCKDFLLFIASQGYETTAEITIDPIMAYSPRFSGMTRHTYDQKRSQLAGIGNLLIYLAERGDIPLCYSAVMARDTATTLSSLKLEIPEAAFQPSKEMELTVPNFLSSLDEERYNPSSKQLYNNDLTNFFLFLEINHMAYSRDMIELWLDRLPKNALWKRRRHTLALFADYLSTGSTTKTSCYIWHPQQIDSLPSWSRNIVTSFVEERQREGLAQSTLVMCRAAGCRFFRFLDSKGVCKADEITPELVKEFHNTEKHSTPESKNAYGIKVRQLLSYMAEQKLVPQNLFLAISTKCAPRRGIVTVMSEEMVSAVYEYRASASTPLELRNIAIVMIGLLMGVRASDIINLRIEDFDWAKRTVSFIQRKTRKAITLPVPIEVGNSVYKYIMEGRPKSSVQGAGLVFIRHLAPFGEIKSVTPCRYALKSILSEYGLKLPPGEGFHITRKTFATRLLLSKNSIDDIANALGHALQSTAEVYLERDEAGMRLCPLPFESVCAI